MLERAHERLNRLCAVHRVLCLHNVQQLFESLGNGFGGGLL